MVIRPDVLYRAVAGYLPNGPINPWNSSTSSFPRPGASAGTRGWPAQFSRQLVRSPMPRIFIFICGRYEGIDERFIQKYVHQQISLGDYILSGGELATMAILDSSLAPLPGGFGQSPFPGRGELCPWPARASLSTPGQAEFQGTGGAGGAHQRSRGKRLPSGSGSSPWK